MASGLIKVCGYLVGGVLCLSIIGAPFGAIIVLLTEILAELEKQNKPNKQ